MRAQQKALEMDGCVAFDLNALGVLIVAALWSELVQPRFDITQQALFLVVQEDRGVRVQGAHENHAVADPALTDGGADARRQIPEFALLLALDRQEVVVNLHARSSG